MHFCCCRCIVALCCNWFLSISLKLSTIKIHCTSRESSCELHTTLLNGISNITKKGGWAQHSPWGCVISSWRLDGRWGGTYDNATVGLCWWVMMRLSVSGLRSNHGIEFHLLSQTTWSSCGTAKDASDQTWKRIRFKLTKRFMKYCMFKDYCKRYATLDRQFSSRIRQILTKVKRTWASLLLLSPGSQHHMISKPDPVRSVSLIFVHAETCLQNAWHFEPTLSFLIRDVSISCIPVEFWVWKFRMSSHFNNRIYLYNRCKRGLRTRQGVSKKCRFQSAAKFRSWQKYMGPVLFLCGSLLLEMQKKSAICISHFGDTYFFSASHAYPHYHSII